MKWGGLGGQVENKSSLVLVVAYDNPAGAGWAHSHVIPGQTTPDTEDIDGFRPLADGVTVTFAPLTGAQQPHLGWWKIRNGHFATVQDNPAGGLLFSITIANSFGYVTIHSDPLKKTDNDFGYAGAATPTRPLT